MKGQHSVVNSQASLELAIQELRDTWERNRWLQLSISTEKAKSKLQFSAMHVFCEWLAEEFNDRGLDMKVVLSHHPEISWSKDTVKEKIWKPVYKAISEKATTTQGSTKDYTDTYDEINKFIGNTWGFHVAWPEDKSKRAA